MKNVLLFTSVVAIFAIVTISCTKESKQDEVKAKLAQTEILLLKSYQVAKSNDSSLKLLVGPNGQFTDPSVMMLDKLYHQNDSLFNLHYLTYCKEMMNGDNMMGGNMMGGNMMGGNSTHGAGMMQNHAFMGDTARVNQNYRELNMIRLAHPTNHPVR